MTEKKHPTNNFEFNEDAEMGFNQWFYEDLYGPYSWRAEWFMGDVETEDLKQRKDAMVKWVHSAFCAGYERAQYATLEAQQLGGTE
jgi:hypothetical protein